MLKTLAVFVASSVGGSLGWWLGSFLGVVAAVFLCLVGSAAGMYYGAKFAKEYTP